MKPWAVVLLLAACSSGAKTATTTVQSSTTVKASTTTYAGSAYIDAMDALLANLHDTYTRVSQSGIATIAADCQALQYQATELGGQIDHARPGADDLLAVSTDAEAAGLSCAQGDYATMTSNLVSLLAHSMNARVSLLQPG